MVIAKDVLAMIAAVHDVVDNPSEKCRDARPVIDRMAEACHTESHEEHYDTRASRAHGSNSAAGGPAWSNSGDGQRPCGGQNPARSRAGENPLLRAPEAFVRIQEIGCERQNRAGKRCHSSHLRRPARPRLM